ncbi:hypothetical protein D3C73_1371840 [compost metagenome]
MGVIRQTGLHDAAPDVVPEGGAALQAVVEDLALFNSAAAAVERIFHRAHDRQFAFAQGCVDVRDHLDR